MSTQPLRSSPTAGLEVMLGWIPLDIHVAETGLNTFSRLHNRLHPKWNYAGKHKQIKGHLGLWNRELSKIYEESYPKEERIDRRVWLPSHNDLNSLTKRNIYTAAAQAGADIGFGWMACEQDYVIDERSFPAKEINVHQAEMLAIQEVLSWIKENDFPDTHWTIWTSSQSTVNNIHGQLARDHIS